MNYSHSNLINLPPTLYNFRNLQLLKLKHFSPFLSIFGFTPWIKNTEGNIQKERKWDGRDRHDIYYKKKISLHLFGLSSIFRSSW
jgi:hypothetical protein